MNSKDFRAEVEAQFDLAQASPTARLVFDMHDRIGAMLRLCSPYWAKVEMRTRSGARPTRRCRTWQGTRLRLKRRSRSADA